jgi:hypothetical protein
VTMSIIVRSVTLPGKWISAVPTGPGVRAAGALGKPHEG